MQQEMLSPIAYFERSGEWYREKKIGVPSVFDRLLDQVDATQKMEFYSRGWAEDFMREFGMRDDWQLGEILLMQSTEGHSIVAKILLHGDPNAPFPKHVFSASNSHSDMRSVLPLSPMRDEHDRTPSMQGGILSTQWSADDQGYRNPDPDPGILVLWKSWSLEQLDRMGLEIAWEDPEDYDQQLPEE